MEYRMLTLLLVLALSACVSPRKAERRCDRALRHITRAMLQCPQGLEVDPVTKTVIVNGDTLKGNIHWNDSLDRDSLTLANEQLSEALRSERELFQMAMEGIDKENNRPRTGLNPSNSRDLKPEPTRTQPATPQLQKAVNNMRRQVCKIDDVVIDQERMKGRIWYDAASNSILFDIQVNPDTVKVTFQPSPSINFNKAQEAAKPHWRVLWWHWVIVAIVALVLLFFMYCRRRLNAILARRNPDNE